MFILLEFDLEIRKNIFAVNVGLMFLNLGRHYELDALIVKPYQTARLFQLSQGSVFFKVIKHEV